jgi:hypothetical protein
MEQPVFGDCVNVETNGAVTAERVKLSGPAEGHFDIRQPNVEEHRHQPNSPAVQSVPAALASDLAALIADWEHCARKQVECAERTDDPMGKRLVQHGATVYSNCANALRSALLSP